MHGAWYESHATFELLRAQVNARLSDQRRHLKQVRVPEQELRTHGDRICVHGLTIFRILKSG